METRAHAPRPPRIISNLRLGTIALVLIAVFMVTLLTAATGDNIADAVLGQIDFSHNGLNNPGAASLDSPSQMAVDLNEHLYIVDGNNNRILGWTNATSFANGQNADIEIGQPDFQTTRCNRGTAGGDVAGLGPDSLCLPGGVAVDSAGNLYVADTSNNRVLEYNQPFVQPRTTGFAANVVFGQNGSFTLTVCAQTANGLCSPQGVASDSSNNLYVVERCQRLIEFEHAMIAVVTKQPLATLNVSSTSTATPTGTITATSTATKIEAGAQTPLKSDQLFARKAAGSRCGPAR